MNPDVTIRWSKLVYMPRKSASCEYKIDNDGVHISLNGKPFLSSPNIIVNQFSDSGGRQYALIFNVHDKHPAFAKKSYADRFKPEVL